MSLGLWIGAAVAAANVLVVGWGVALAWRHRDRDSVVVPPARPRTTHQRRRAA